MVELTEVIGKRGNGNFTSLLNEIWKVEIESNVEKTLIIFNTLTLCIYLLKTIMLDNTVGN